jgi:hypothetical protein
MKMTTQHRIKGTPTERQTIAAIIHAGILVEGGAGIVGFHPVMV